MDVQTFGFRNCVAVATKIQQDPATDQHVKEIDGVIPKLVVDPTDLFPREILVLGLRVVVFVWSRGHGKGGRSRSQERS